MTMVAVAAGAAIILRSSPTSGDPACQHTNSQCCQTSANKFCIHKPVTHGDAHCVSLGAQK